MVCVLHRSKRVKVKTLIHIGNVWNWYMHHFHLYFLFKILNHNDVVRSINTRKHAFSIDRIRQNCLFLHFRAHYYLLL